VVQRDLHRFRPDAMSVNDPLHRRLLIRPQGPHGQLQWICREPEGQFQGGLCGRRRSVPEILDGGMQDTTMSRSIGILLDADRRDTRQGTHVLQIRKIVQQDLACTTDDPRGELDPANLGVLRKVVLQQSAMPLAVPDVLGWHLKGCAWRARSFLGIGIHGDRMDPQFRLVRRNRLVPELDASPAAIKHGSARTGLRPVSSIQARLRCRGIRRSNQSDRRVPTMGIAADLSPLSNR
jgi:hypothetical protein